MKTRNLLAIDGLGALVSAVSLGLLLPMLKAYVGLPTYVLHLFASIAAFFAVYSFLSFRFSGERWRQFLRVIAIANIAYCIFTAGLLCVHIESLAPLGLLYFVGEITLILSLASWELWVSFQK